MTKVFISYRRSDTQMAAGRLRESLLRRFGDAAIFRDKDSIPAGTDWVDAIRSSVKEDALVLALIGPGWLEASDASGRRRLDDPEDWNRIEIEQSLQLARLVVPVLVDNAQAPAAAQLPESLKALARTNAIRLRDDDWDSDVDKIARVLIDHGLPPAPAAGGRAAPTGSKRTVVVALVAAAIVGGAGAWWFSRPGPEVTPASPVVWTPAPVSKPETRAEVRPVAVVTPAAAVTTPGTRAEARADLAPASKIEPQPADKGLSQPPPRPDASLTGSWTLTQANDNGREFVGTLTLRQDDRTLSGTVVWANKEAEHEISNGRVDGDAVSFTARGPLGRVRTYEGRLDAGGKLLQGAGKGGASGEAQWNAVRKSLEPR